MPQLILAHRQVDALLLNRIVRSNRRLMKIFRIKEADEPSHWAPYDSWLNANAKRARAGGGRALDGMIHSELLLVKLPLLFCSSPIPRRTDWADERDDADRLPEKPFKLTAAT